LFLVAYRITVGLAAVLEFNARPAPPSAQ